jgi:hypothetical protein
MKQFLFVMAIILSSFKNTGTTDKIGVKGPLTFNKTVFDLSWVSNPNSNYYVQEYLPKNESEDHFNQMLSIFLLIGNTTPAEAAQQKANELTARKSIDATCNFAISRSADKKEILLDFVLGEKGVEEFNVYRYKQIDLPDKQKALLLYAYSKRAYGNNVTTFLQNLKTERTNIVNEMAAIQLPAINLNKQ